MLVLPLYEGVFRYAQANSKIAKKNAKSIDQWYHLLLVAECSQNDNPFPSPSISSRITVSALISKPRLPLGLIQICWCSFFIIGNNAVWHSILQYWNLKINACCKLETLSFEIACGSWLNYPQLLIGNIKSNTHNYIMILTFNFRFSIHKVVLLTTYYVILKH